jgi:hypothetical protein
VYLNSLEYGDWVMCCIGGDGERQVGESQEKFVILTRLSFYPDPIIGIRTAAKSWIAKIFECLAAPVELL